MGLTYRWGFAELPTLRESVYGRLVEDATGCWVWQGARTSSGYGNVSDGAGLLVVTHRLVWVWERGPVPAGLDLDHLCRNRACANPAHLEPVTRRENIRRGTGPTAVNMAKVLCAQGHPLPAPLRPGRQRVCLPCQAAAVRRYKARLAGLPR